MRMMTVVMAVMAVMGAGVASAQSVPTTAAAQIRALIAAATRKGDETWLMLRYSSHGSAHAPAAAVSKLGQTDDGQSGFSL